MDFQGNNCPTGQQLLVPITAREQLIRTCHRGMTSGHIGTRKTEEHCSSARLLDRMVIEDFVDGVANATVITAEGCDDEANLHPQQV